MADSQPPAFADLANQFAEAASQYSRLVDSPDNRGDNQILEVLKDIRAELGNIHEEIKEVKALVQDKSPSREAIKVQQRETEQSLREAATTHNEAAFKANITSLVALDSPLLPFHHYLTNTIIPNFPKTLRDISLLQDSDLSDILAAIGVENGGTMQKKRFRLANSVGLRSCIYMLEGI